jgi:hypothetical protein
MAKKVDVVIEAVRYKNGQIVQVRGYDRILIYRKTLIEKLQKGNHVLIGSREEFQASTFKLDGKVMLVKQENREWVSTGTEATQDHLENAPIF